MNWQLFRFFPHSFEMWKTETLISHIVVYNRNDVLSIDKKKNRICV